MEIDGRRCVFLLFLSLARKLGFLLTLCMLHKRVIVMVFSYSVVQQGGPFLSLPGEDIMSLYIIEQIAREGSLRGVT